MEQGEELVLKFFAYLYNRDKFGNSVKNFLNAFAEEAKAAFDYEAAKPLFENVVRQLAGLISGPLLRGRGKVTPLNELEAVMVACAEILKSGKKFKKPPKDWLNDEKLVGFSSAGTNSRTMLFGRIDRAAELLGGKAK